jgi:ribosomal protein S18 acetylase RimI-like enzyme
MDGQGNTLKRDMKKTTLKIKISKAEAMDAQEIRKLEHLVWGEEVTNQYDSPMFIRFGYVFTAKEGKKLVGALVAFATNKNEVFVSDIVVHPSYQGKKIGESLYRKPLQSVKGKNVVSFLDPDLVPTLNLHKKLGGKIVARIKNAYDLKEGLETGVRYMVRIKN